MFRLSNSEPPRPSRGFWGEAHLRGPEAAGTKTDKQPMDRRSPRIENPPPIAPLHGDITHVEPLPPGPRVPPACRPGARRGGHLLEGHRPHLPEALPGVPPAGRGGPHAA